jgi:hypothetical protein
MFGIKHIISKYHVGDLVAVLPKGEISKTVDSTNARDGLRFTDQMVGYCGSKYKVLEVVSSFYLEEKRRPYYPTLPMYILEGVMCNGKGDSFSVSCDRGCYLLWHERWLDTGDPLKQKRIDGIDFLKKQVPCQLQYLNDIKTKDDWFKYTLWRLQRYLRRLIASTVHISRLGKVKSFLLRQLKLGDNDKGDIGAIFIDQFEVGEVVKVRSRDEINKILNSPDSKGRFLNNMYYDCGKELIVQVKVDYYFDEVKRKICKLEDTYLLQGSHCYGKGSQCDRRCFNFWHASWLKKT